MDQVVSGPKPSFSLRRLVGGKGWQNALAAAGLLVATALVVLAYATGPQSLGDFSDRIQLAVGEGGYGPNLRVGDRLRARASRARLAGWDSLADALEWRAARVFSRAAAAVSGPREELAANDRLADSYLQLGWSYLAAGRGRRFGFGRQSDALRSAEDIAACVVGVAPTRRRAEINTFVEDLERTLDRAIAGRCPP